jgi:hypothetical protein
MPNPSTPKPTPAAGDRTPDKADDRLAPKLDDYIHPMAETGAVTPDKPVGQMVTPPATAGDPILPREPSFGICEGTRQELLLKQDQAETDPKVKVEARSPFTGATLTEDSPAVEVYAERNDRD